MPLSVCPSVCLYVCLLVCFRGRAARNKKISLHTHISISHRLIFILSRQWELQWTIYCRLSMQSYLQTGNNVNRRCTSGSYGDDGRNRNDGYGAAVFRRHRRWSRHLKRRTSQHTALCVYANAWTLWRSNCWRYAGLKRTRRRCVGCSASSARFNWINQCLTQPDRAACLQTRSRALTWRRLLCCAGWQCRSSNGRQCSTQGCCTAAVATDARNDDIAR